MKFSSFALLRNRKEREKMSSFFKKTACVTGIILLGLFGLIGFYSTTLPDFYLVSKGSELSVNSFFTISSKPCESKVTVAVSGGSSGASRYAHAFWGSASQGG